MVDAVTPEEKKEVAGFASGLGLLKAKQELGEGAELTAQEVSGLIWGIKQLRGGVIHGPADHAAKR
jgi:hypothetical protein